MLYFVQCNTDSGEGMYDSLTPPPMGVQTNTIFLLTTATYPIFVPALIT